MDWFLWWRGGFEALLGGSPRWLHDAHDENVRASHAGFWGTEQPSAVDAWLLELVYQFLAANTSCARCGAPLGRGLRVVLSPTFGPPQRWRVSVVTSCRGWRRHGHTADIARPTNDIVLGAFHPSSGPR